MLIQTITGKFLNTAHMRELKVRGRGDDLFIEGDWADGTSFREEVSQDVYDTLQVSGDTQPQLVPSPPGYFLLRYWLDDDERDFTDREPVLAWRFDAELGFHGVFTAFDWPEGNQYILVPSGQVVYPGSQIWDDEKAWVKYMREEALAKKAREAKKKAAG